MNPILAPILAPIFVGIFCANVVVVADSMERRLTLDADDKFRLAWSFTGRQPSDNITFRVEVETTGWVGIGFSTKGSMAGADIVVAWVDASGQTFLQDMMANANTLPVRDESQDVHLVSATESDGKTVVTFIRRLDTCDNRDRPLRVDTTRLIYAYGDVDPTKDELEFRNYHNLDRRGSKSVYLFDTVKLLTHIPTDARTYDVLNDKYEVPAGDTTYHCSFHATPQLKKKYHLIGYEPVITPGNEGLVHHAVLFACWNVTLEHLRSTDKMAGVCRTPEMPEFVNSCTVVVFAWGVGGGNYYFPEGTGYPFGEADSPQLLLMEMHYDNPSGKAGVLDSSGLRLIYTPTVRQIDVGVVEVGVVHGIMVPPKADAFEVTAYCLADCFGQGVADEGVTVFSFVLHAHLLAVGIRVEVFRPGQPPFPLAADDMYDFNYQENRLLNDYIRLYPNDTLKITCTMDSSDRTHVTAGGFSTREEMCLAFLGYYPKGSVAICGSYPNFMVDPTDGLFEALGTEYREDKDLPLADVHTTFYNVSWTDERRVVAQKLLDESGQLPLCTVNGMLQDNDAVSDVQPVSASPPPPGRDAFCANKRLSTSADGPRNHTSATERVTEPNTRPVTEPNRGPNSEPVTEPVTEPTRLSSTRRNSSGRPAASWTAALLCPALACCRYA